MYFKNEHSKKRKMKTLFIIDVLYMRDINAVYGYKNGNKLLKQLLTLFNSNILNKLSCLLNKKTDITIINPYADVFMLKIGKDLDNTLIKKISDILIESITTYNFSLKKDNISIYLDVTIGCSKSNDDKLMIYAEKALQNAKLNYLNYSYFDPIFFKNDIADTLLIKRLKDSVSSNKIVPYFQTIVDNTSNKVHKYESLMRLIDDEGTVISPYYFLNQAKKYRLYPKLMLTMIDKVLLAIHKHKIHVSINLEYNDIMNPLLKNKVLEYIKKYNIGQYLTIEILESEKIHDFSLVQNFIREVKEYDVKIAIDDFGSGFSNYEHILELDIDYIKLDGSLVQKLNEDIYYNLVKSIVSFCKKQNIKIVAEFVKNIEILRYVKSLEIDYSQGYYLSEPESLSSIIKDKNEK